MRFLYHYLHRRIWSESFSFLYVCKGIYCLNVWKHCCWVQRSALICFVRALKIWFHGLSYDLYFCSTVCNPFLSLGSGLCGFSPDFRRLDYNGPCCCFPWFRCGMFSPSPRGEGLVPSAGFGEWLDPEYSARQLEQLIHQWLQVGWAHWEVVGPRTSGFLGECTLWAWVSVSPERLALFWLFPLCLCSMATVRCPPCASTLMCFSPGPEEWSQAVIGFSLYSPSRNNHLFQWVFVRCFHKDARLMKTLGACWTFWTSGFIVIMFAY